MKILQIKHDNFSKDIMEDYYDVSLGTMLKIAWSVNV
jgi:hypothetical protein